MKTYLDYVKTLEQIRSQADQICFESNICSSPQGPSPGAPCVCLFSPHPDDESITGALPLRLRKESGWHIVNAAVTCGSLSERREERAKELKNACAFLGFTLEFAQSNGLENISLQARSDDRQHWQHATLLICRLLEQYTPRIIFIPHKDDHNSTHIGTHHLVLDALRLTQHGPDFVVETEYWYPMAAPNVLIESSSEDVAELVSAVSLHKKEVKRNPYHLLLPSWMQDSVRRGSEYLSGQGSAFCGFPFGTLYRINRWDGKALTPAPPSNPFVMKSENPADLFL